jgi:MinD superfamily P-loop ATPase
MRIAIASGKGGTGKTTLAVNLATVLAAEGPVGLLDCDVEEPNCHLYLRPGKVTTAAVSTAVPVIDEQACTACGLCARACEFHALVALPGRPLLLPELCHGCGVCAFVCPEQAISDGGRQIGVLGIADVSNIHLRWGTLDVGEARATPLVKAVKDLDALTSSDVLIVDAPPGVSCPAVEAQRGADFAVLVTEPTPFGLHDLELAVETARQMGIPCGVVVNRVGIGDDRVKDYSARAGVPILMEIPDDRRVAEACSRGEVIAKSYAHFAAGLRRLARDLRGLVEQSATGKGSEDTAVAE